MYTKKVITYDVFVKNGSLSFDRARAINLQSNLPNLAAVSFISSEPSLPRDMSLLTKACVESVEPLLFSDKQLREKDKVWLFAAHGPWQPKSAMVKHKKLWNSFLSKWNLSAFCLYDEITIESDQGIRFAGIAQVSREALLTASQIVEQERSCAMILSNRREISSEDGIRYLFDSAFLPKDSVNQVSIDWLNLALRQILLGDSVIKVSGSWDERESSFDIILLQEKLGLLGYTELKQESILEDKERI